MATFVLGVAIAILVYLLRGRINTVTTVVCPSDYYGTNCERDDFLDVITWSSMSEMKLADGSCFSGCSFRTWAPGASMVRLLFFLYSSFSPSYYTMREQRNGFWFLMLCSCHPGSYYKFQVDYSTESGYFLSLGASERTSNAIHDISSVLPDFSFDWNSDNIGQGSSLSSPSVIYHIHLPTYVQPEYETAFNTVSTRLATMARVGINAIELNALEFMYCEEDISMVCWDQSSYSPGLLRPSLGSRRQLKQLVREAHRIQMPIIIDLNWDCFSRNTLLWEYNHIFSLYQQKASDTVISGLFNQSACGTYGCPLNLENSEVVLYLLRSVLQMYRDEFHIDGIRFITMGGQFLGGSCEKKGTISTDDVALNDVWKEIRAMGFFIITDDVMAVPDYDYFIDESLCEKINRVSTTGVDPSLLIEIATRANNTEENVFLCFECFRSLNSRIYVRSGYNVSSLLYSFFYLMPTHLHFFMGTPFFSDVPFQTTPSVLDLKAVGVYQDGGVKQPGVKYMKLLVSQDLATIRSTYYSGEKMHIFLDKDDRENHILVFHLDSTPFLLLVINYGDTSYGSSSPYRLQLPPFSQSGKDMWRILFQNTNKRYDITLGDKLLDLVSTDCYTANPTESIVCYDLVMGSHSLAFYSLVQ
ncbi:hypothetical protein WA538_005858, partial [Blastocystis sp. DL]